MKTRCQKAWGNLLLLKMFDHNHSYNSGYLFSKEKGAISLF